MKELTFNSTSAMLVFNDVHDIRDSIAKSNVMGVLMVVIVMMMGVGVSGTGRRTATQRRRRPPPPETTSPNEK